MSIYSANRTGSMSIDTAAIAETYNINDIGTILCECNTNDMAFFEAVLRCDFSEITGLREGTLLEAEVKKLNKESFKAAIDKIKERLKKYWGKIKQVFDNAINKISAYISTNKGFVKTFRKVYEKANWKGSIEHYEFKIDHSQNFVFNKKTTDEMTKEIKNATSVASSENARFVDNALAKMVKNADSDYNRKNFVKDVLKDTKKTVTIDNSTVMDTLNVVSTGKGEINSLKEAQKDAKAKIEKFIKDLANDDFEKSDLKLIYKRASDMETIINFTTKASIAVVRANIKAARTGLQKVLSDIHGATKVEHEFALIEAAESFDNFMDDDYAEFENEINTDEFED